MTAHEMTADIARCRPDLRVLAVGQLIRGGGVEAVVQDRRGRQGVWPLAWCRTPGCLCVGGHDGPKRQRGLFDE